VKPAKKQAKEQSVVVVYLPKRLKSGPNDGSCPAPVAEEERRRELPPLERTRALEEQLIATDYQHSQGDELTDGYNIGKLRKALKPLLVDQDTALAITGGQT